MYAKRGNRAPWAAAGLLLALGMLACSDSGEKGGAVSEEPIIGEADRVVATVNGDSITLGEVNRVVGAYRTGRFPQADPAAPEGTLQRLAIDELLGQRLLFDEARKAGVAPPDSEVNVVMERMRGQFPNPEGFEQALSQQGLTEKDLAQGYRLDMGIRRFVESTVQTEIAVSDEEAVEFYEANPQNFTRPEQVHGRHILIRVPEGADEVAEGEARQKIEAISDRIEGGEDFAAVAQEASEDPGSGQRGGDLGFFQRGQMVPPFDSVSFALPVGTLSDPVRTRFGYHLIEILEKEEPELVPYEEVQGNVVQGLRGQKTQDRVEELVESLKQKADIQRNY